MSTVAARPSGPDSLGSDRSSSIVLATFAGTLLLSALLLFSVQPIFAKLVLPRLGGSPSVWAVSMVFFQAVLLAGYCYAHLANRWLPASVAPLLHLALCGVAALALPFGLPEIGEPPAGDAYVWLIGVLALGVGLPFFAVSANAPLLQAWFARMGHRDSADPYFLYGASNLGSLVALLSYPFVIEPALGLSAQGIVWTSGFIGLTALIAVCGVMSAAARRSVELSGRASVAAAANPDWRDRAVWVGLAFVPSGLLVAFTTFIATDIASAPLLWVIPLALFLLTFMLVFCERPPIRHDWLVAAQPVLVCITVLGLIISGKMGITIAVYAGSAAFFVTMMVCHRELYLRRPAGAHLTEFYLWMSVGGVLGGIFAALVAPQIFNTILELPLLLVAGLACRPGIAEALADPQRRQRAFVILGAGAAAVTVLVALIWAGLPRTGVIGASGALALVFITAAVVLDRASPLNITVYGIIGCLACALLPSPNAAGHVERSFFGVHRVVTTDDGEARMLLHGTTVHGVQRLKDADGRAIERPLPATYYHPSSPMALGIGIARRHAPAGRTFDVGMVGLGAGSMACYVGPSDRWRFYEIDPVVVRIARDPSLFTYISTCHPGADIVTGDARLTLAKEPAGRFDYLVVDAFSSDAVPVHLITREAIELYLDKVGPAGLVALHISNRHLDLVAVASALVASLPGVHGVYALGDGDLKNYNIGSVVLFVSRSDKVIADAATMKGAKPLPPPSVRPWTDDRSDILSVLWR